MALRININTATRDDLLSLKGVGPTLADRILAHRTRIDGFDNVKDLEHVPGLSERLVEEIRGSVTTSEDKNEDEPPTLINIKFNPGDASGDYLGFNISFAGRQSTPDQPLPFAITAPLGSEGTASVSLPNRNLLFGDVRVDVTTPDGARAIRRSFTPKNLPNPLLLDVIPRAVGTTQPNDDPTAGKPQKVRGRVIDEGGKKVPADLQVVLWAATKARPVDADFIALVVAATDSQGHFTGPYPVGNFSSAHATVAVDDDPQNISIHLLDGEFPESVILVIDLPEASPAFEEDCSCNDASDPPRSPDATDLARADGTFSSDPGAGRCVDFSKPDRTLEEFTFAYAVRTTEPEIKGLTLDEPGKIDLGKIQQLFTATRATQLQMMAKSSGTDSEKAAAASAERGEFNRDVETARGKTLEGIEVDAKLLRTLARDPDGFSLTTLIKSAELSKHRDLQRLLGRIIIKRPPGRERLSCSNIIDWDDEPTIYQACTIAHGHLLRFKQEWVADGYSMGNLLYSLPLAPGQKKQISIVDWERRESAARSERLDASEQLDASLSRDRDVSDVVRGTLNESSRGGSSSSTGGVAGGGGLGFIGSGFGGLLGIAGGFASASSSAWQNSSRNTSASALNQLRDRTTQSASAVRSQRSSVVQTVRQGERVEATTESVANYNHCHAITIQYFEVLRHLLVRQRLTDVQECLFVPLMMSWFTSDKALRWRDTLYRSLPRRLRKGFGALDRIANNYQGSDFPSGRYADEQVLSVDGNLRLRFQIARPRDNDDDEFDPNAWNPLLTLFGFNPADFYNQFLRDQRFKDRVFLEQLGPRIASTVVSRLRVQALRQDGSTVDLNMDPTLISTFRNNRELYVTLRMDEDPDPVNRADIKAIVLSSRLQLPGLPFIIDALPSGSRVIVESGAIRYRTAHYTDYLFRDRRIQNDMTARDDVRIETPLNRRELRNPREEDKEYARNLLDHLNEHIERFHHIIWSRMSDDRRYMLLDGFEAPNANGRSVASVVENELIGIAGNCLILPVARGYHLDPTFKQDQDKPIDLLEHYQPNTPLEPSRIALPTKGVFAEAVMGACNSCEFKDEARFWRWEESPIPDSPPAIGVSSTDSRKADAPNLQAKDFAAPIVAMQQAPAAPDPAGVGGVLQLLGQSGIFRDMAGLEGTQRNAAAALEAAFKTATTFGTKAADLALQGAMVKDVDKAMRTIQSAKSQGLINDQQAGDLTEAAIRGLVGAGTTNPPKATTTKEVKELTKTAGDNDAAVKVTRPTGEQVEVDARPSAEDRAVRPVIILDSKTSSAETRAFNPASNDRTGIISVEASFRNAPAGSRLRWSSPDKTALLIDSPASQKTRVRGLIPGLHDLDVALLDAGGNRIASQKLQLSVPQYVQVVETAADFDAALASINLPAHKNKLIAHSKTVVEHLLSSSNVRVYWQLGGINQPLPAHVTATNITTVTIRNTDPSNVLGVTNGPGGLNQFDKAIQIFPGAYHEPDDIDVDTETQALIIQLGASLPGDPLLQDFAAEVYGRLVGETIAHEIIHALLWDQISPTGFHNDPPITNGLMNPGFNRTFGQRTGMENTAQISPVEPGHFVDHGIAAIGGLQPVNQAIMDLRFPVPPALT